MKFFLIFFIHILIKYCYLYCYMKIIRVIWIWIWIWIVIIFNHSAFHSSDKYMLVFSSMNKAQDKKKSINLFSFVFCFLFLSIITIYFSFLFYLHKLRAKNVFFIFYFSCCISSVFLFFFLISFFLITIQHIVTVQKGNFWIQIIFFTSVWIFILIQLKIFFLIFCLFIEWWWKWEIETVFL